MKRISNGVRLLKHLRWLLAIMPRENIAWLSNSVIDHFDEESASHAEALHMLGVIAWQNRDLNTAIDYLQRSVACNGVQCDCLEKPGRRATHCPKSRVTRWQITSKRCVCGRISRKRTPIWATPGNIWASGPRPSSVIREAVSPPAQFGPASMVWAMPCEGKVKWGRRPRPFSKLCVYNQTTRTLFTGSGLPCTNRRAGRGRGLL